MLISDSVENLDHAYSFARLATVSAPIVEDPDEETTPDPSPSPGSDNETPDPPPSPIPQPDQPVEILAARTAASGTIRGAVIAVVAGVLGALTAGVFTYVTTNRQIDAAAQQASASFLRTQEQAAYSAFLTDQDLLTDDEASYRTLLEPQSPRPAPTKLIQYKDAVDSDLIKMSQEVSNITLIGSGQAANIANRIAELHGSRYDYIRVSSELIESNSSDTATLATCYNMIDYHGDDIENARANFVDQARSDLGTDQN